MSTIFQNLGIDVGIIIILLMIVAIILIILMMAMTNEMKRLRRQYKSFMKGMDGASLEQNFRSKFNAIEKMGNIQDLLDSDNKILHLTQDRALTKYGVVKYDAFDDMGGKLSFVLALLDKSNTGIVLNAIHSKENCFLYIKEVVNGESYIQLSNEEIEALQKAEQFGMEEDIIAQYEMSSMTASE